MHQKGKGKGKGKEKPPSSFKKYWDQLTCQERAAATTLGYNEKSWDKGGKKDEPASANKYWAELTACGKDLSIYPA